MKRILATLALAAAAMLSTGCMTMARGTTENVRVISSPPAAAVRVEKGGVLVGECSSTPCDFVLKRKEPPYQVTVSKDGCETAIAMLERDHDTGKGLAGNLIGAGGIVGIGVDRVSGAGYSVKPNPLTVNLDCN